MHNDIQNELIELMAKQVLAKKLESIRSRKFFGIIADGYIDISNKELLSCVFDGSNKELLLLLCVFDGSRI